MIPFRPRQSSTTSESHDWYGGLDADSAVEASELKLKYAEFRLAEVRDVTIRLDDKLDVLFKFVVAITGAVLMVARIADAGPGSLVVVGPAIVVFLLAVIACLLGRRPVAQPAPMSIPHVVEHTESENVLRIRLAASIHTCVTGQHDVNEWKAALLSWATFFTGLGLFTLAVCFVTSLFLP